MSPTNEKPSRRKYVNNVENFYATPLVAMTQTKYMQLGTNDFIYFIDINFRLMEFMFV